MSAPARILIVEDEPQLALDLEAALASLGYAVAGIARTAAHAVARVAELDPDLVLMDIWLEGEATGIDAAEVIQRQHGVPVVFLTANTDPAVLERALRTDPNGYLAKPYNQRTLAATIEIALRRHESESALRSEREDLARSQRALEQRSQELGNLAERYRQESILDPLTNLYNRRHLDTVLKRELSLAQRERHPVGFIMLDLDLFKQVNDTFGHAAGDQVLQSIGQYLRLRLRAYDVPCRYGGEEFAIVLPGASLDDTGRVAEQLRAGIERLRVEDAGRPIGVVTASFGAAAFPDQGGEPETLVRAADEALYRAKRSGRNQVALATRVASDSDTIPRT